MTKTINISEELHSKIIEKAAEEYRPIRMMTEYIISEYFKNLERK